MNSQQNSPTPLLFSTVGLLRRYCRDLRPQSILVATADLICLAKYVMNASFFPVELSYNHILCCLVTSQQGIADKSLYIIINGLCQGAQAYYTLFSITKLHKHITRGVAGALVHWQTDN